MEGKMLDEWFANGIPTEKIWRQYGLEKIPEGQLANNAGYKTYYRYAKRYDSAIYHHMGTIFQPPTYYGGPPGELNVKVKMWVEKGRPRWYVKEMLGLDEVPKSELMADQHYKKFLELKDKK